jgi:uncharacterized phage protein (TIGR02218 family)
VSYASREISEQDAAPIELYLFARAVVDRSDPCSPVDEPVVLQRYTSAEEAMEYDGETWAPENLRRSNIEATTEQPRLPIKITTRRNMAIAELFRVTPPTDVISVTVYRLHRDSSPAEAAVLWMGRVLNCNWDNTASATLTCEPVSTSIRRPGLRRMYQRQCPHVLYGGACGVDRSSHVSATTVTDISGRVLTVASLLSRPYAGGYVEFETESGVFERRFIRSASGNALTLALPFNGLAVSDAVNVYPGCDHTMDTCNTVYSNLPNYGGFPFIPSKNPFDGNPVY